MPKGSEELTNARKKEIMNACKTLYQTMGFKEVTIKEIGNVTSFTRTSIYNYFQTKEEIFLAILQEEYEEWNGELTEIIGKTETMERSEFAEILSDMLARRGLLLKILSMNMYDIEGNSRIERLVEFKKQYGKCLSLVEQCLQKVVPKMKKEERISFLYSFFPFVFGIYPYTSVTEKQKEAMKIAGIDYQYYSIHDMALQAIKKLLGAE